MSKTSKNFSWHNSCNLKMVMFGWSFAFHFCYHTFEGTSHNILKWSYAIYMRSQTARQELKQETLWRWWDCDYETPNLSELKDRGISSWDNMKWYHWHIFLGFSWRALRKFQWLYNLTQVHQYHEKVFFAYIALPIWLFHIYPSIIIIFIYMSDIILFCQWCSSC